MHTILENQEDNAFWTKEQGSYSWRNKNPLLSRICRTVTMRFFADKWKFNELIYDGEISVWQKANAECKPKSPVSVFEHGIVV